MAELAAWLSSLPLGQALRRLNWLVPWLQVIHILANGAIIAAAVMIDLRALRLSRSLTTAAMARRFQAWIWGALAVLTVSGVLLVALHPAPCAQRPRLRDCKMVTMGLAVAVTVALAWTMRPRRSAAGTADNADTRRSSPRCLRP